MEVIIKVVEVEMAAYTGNSLSYKVSFISYSILLFQLHYGPLVTIKIMKIN